MFGYITGSVASYFVGKDATDSAGADVRALREEVAELKVMLVQALEQRGG